MFNKVIRYEIDGIIVSISFYLFNIKFVVMKIMKILNMILKKFNSIKVFFDGELLILFFCEGE